MGDFLSNLKKSMMKRKKNPKRKSKRTIQTKKFIMLKTPSISLVHLLYNTIRLFPYKSNNTIGYMGAKDKLGLKNNQIKTIVNLTTKNCDSHYKDEFNYVEYDVRD